MSDTYSAPAREYCLDHVARWLDQAITLIEGADTIITRRQHDTREVGHKTVAEKPDGKIDILSSEGADAHTKLASVPDHYLNENLQFETDPKARDQILWILSGVDEAQLGSMDGVIDLRALKGMDPQERAKRFIDLLEGYRDHSTTLCHYTLMEAQCTDSSGDYKAAEPRAAKYSVFDQVSALERVRQVLLRTGRDGFQGSGSCTPITAPATPQP